MKYSCSCNDMAINGAGSIRAHNRRVRVNQHCIIVFSINIKEPLTFSSHQKSYERCSLQLTAMTEEQNVKMNDLKHASTSHEGKCYPLVVFLVMTLSQID